MMVSNCDLCWPGMTDSICCSVDTPYSNCASSGANDYIEIEGAREPPIVGFGVERVGDGNRSVIRLQTFHLTKTPVTKTKLLLNC